MKSPPPDSKSEKLAAVIPLLPLTPTNSAQKPDLHRDEAVRQALSNSEAIALQAISRTTLFPETARHTVVIS